jgi:hypothetical protein
MKRFIIIFLFLPVFTFAQERITLKGNVFDGVTFFPIVDANIYNFSSKQYRFTDKDGNFEILAKEGDTIIVSKPIYRQDIIIVTSEIMEKKFINVPLYYKVIVLKEVNVFGLPSTFDEFKKDFVNTNLSNFYRAIDGTMLSPEERVAYSPGGNLLKLIPGEFGKAVTSPISYFYDKYSRRARLGRLYQELVENQEEIDRLPLKYNRELVSSLTGLTGEELLNFMVFCRFSYYDLIRWSPEFIIAQIKSKFDDFEFHRALQGN